MMSWHTQRPCQMEKRFRCLQRQWMLRGSATHTDKLAAGVGRCQQQGRCCLYTVIFDLIWCHAVLFAEKEPGIVAYCGRAGAVPTYGH
jgi:hypothetical protein